MLYRGWIRQGLRVATNTGTSCAGKTHLPATSTFFTHNHHHHWNHSHVPTSSYSTFHSIFTSNYDDNNHPQVPPKRSMSTRYRTQQRSSPPQSPYEILQVERNANEKEIKIAYFRQAKKFHPDLNPNDPQAKRKFQEVANAYELLSDPKRRAMYDSMGYTGDNTATGGSSSGGSSSGGNSNAYAEQQAKHAEDLFNMVSEDFDVVKEALTNYSQDVKDEISYAVECIRRQDWSELYEVAKIHKGVIFGIVVPVFVFLRYPPAVFGALRLFWLGSQMAIGALMYTGNLHVAARMIWKRIVELSKEQKERRERRNRD